MVPLVYVKETGEYLVMCEAKIVLLFLPMGGFFALVLGSTSCVLFASPSTYFVRLAMPNHSLIGCAAKK